MAKSVLRSMKNPLEQITGSPDASQPGPLPPPAGPGGASGPPDDAIELIVNW